MYTDTFTVHVSEAVGQLIGQFCEFLQIWEAKELELPSEITLCPLLKKSKRKAQRHKRRATGFFSFIPNWHLYHFGKDAAY